MISVLKPTTKEELFAILDKEDKSFLFLAGGTDIMPSIKKGIEKREDIIDLSALREELSGISKEGNQVVIKAMTTFAKIQKNDLIVNHFPAFIKSAKLIGGHTIQNMATLAGNIVNASPAADSLPPLLTLKASVKLLSSQGERIVELKDFYKGYKKLEIKNNEIISEIIIPLHDYKSEFVEIGTRRAMSITKISFAYSYNDEEILLSAGSAFAYPTRLIETEKIFRNPGLTKVDIEEALKKDVSPLDDVRSTGEYRFKVLRNLTFDLYKKLN